MIPDGHRIHLPMLAVLIIVAVAGAASVAAAPNTVNVDCSKETIADALTKKNPDEPLEVIVSGTCTENVLLIRDDVTLRALAPGSGAVNAANAGAATILIDGARRVRLDNLTISGGAGGIVGRRGASFDVTNCVVNRQAVRRRSAQGRPQHAGRVRHLPDEPPDRGGVSRRSLRRPRDRYRHSAQPVDGSGPGARRCPGADSGPISPERGEGAWCSS